MDTLCIVLGESIEHEPFEFSITSSTYVTLRTTFLFDLCCVLTMSTSSSGSQFSLGPAMRNIYLATKEILLESLDRCFGLTKAEANQVCAIMEEIVWPNMFKYMAQHITQNLAVWTLATNLGAATGLGFGLVAVFPFPEATAVARVIVRGACDLIIVLDQAFRWGGKELSPDLVRRAAAGYRRESVVGMSVSTRSKMHYDINSMFLIISKTVALMTVPLWQVRR